MTTIDQTNEKIKMLKQLISITMSQIEALDKIEEAINRMWNTNVRMGEMLERISQKEEKV